MTARSRGKPDAQPLKGDARRVVVTGGGSGLGRAIALDFAHRGMRVFVVGRTRSKLEETRSLAPPDTVIPLVADIRDAQRVDELFTAAETDGPVPLLVNAAAGAFHAPALDLTPNGFRSVLDSSLTGPFFVLQRWARSLAVAGPPGAAVILTSAFAGREEPGVAHSIAAKAGMEALVRSVAVEWGGLGLRVNCVAPGVILTEGAMLSTWNDTARRERALSATPLGRFGEPAEIVAAARYLLGEEAGFTTGASLVVDGGWRLTPPPF